MSTSSAHQQSLTDAGSETRPPMLEGGSYIPWIDRESRFNIEFDQFSAEPIELVMLVYNRFAQCYNCNKKGQYARNCLKPRVQDYKYFMKQMLLAKKDEARIILYNEQSDFLLANTVQMEELEELSANICMMAIIQPANVDFDEGPSYDSAFISEVQTPSTSYMNDDHDQTYPEQPKIIKSTIGNDQINNNIIFDDPNVKVNTGNVDHDKFIHDLCELEQLARNAYKETEKQQVIANKVKQQIVVLTKQLEKYKERV
uniref:CCHC-type domain-containing protein n=1 Tax=Tanacetum cinerariifolium TaxID=118510 RepID=A0A699GZ51_TANCI|nr:hypothetical protein [Tanacetum cinerariifolium]